MSVAAIAGALRRLLVTDLDGRALTWTRRLVGLAALLRAPDTGRILHAVLAPTHLRVPYDPRVPALPAGALPWFLALWGASAILFGLGRLTRPAGVVLIALMCYVLAFDQQTFSHHLYLLCWIVLLLLLGQADRSGRAPAWPLFLLELQLSTVYFFSAISKLNAPYLCGAVLSVYLRREGPLALPEGWRRPELLAPAAIASVWFELMLAVAFWSPRYRRLAAITGLAFHLLLVVLIEFGVALQLIVFCVEMVALYTVFFATRAPVPAARQTRGAGPPSSRWRG